MLDPIVGAVANRWKVVTAKLDWFGDAEQVDTEPAIDSLKVDFRGVKGYKAKCVYLAQIYRKLAEPLETPKIAEYADLMDKRVKDVDQLMGLLQGGDRLLTKAEKDFEQFIEDVAKGERKIRGGLIEAVYDLPSFDAVLKMAKEASKVQERLINEDNDGDIDWTLEEYIGPESKVYHKIEKNGADLASWFSDGFTFSGAWALYGFLKYHIDAKYIEELIESAKNALDEGEEEST